MDLLAMLQDYFVIPVIVFCLVVGYCIKHVPALDKYQNSYIPITLVVLGAVVSLVLNIGKMTDVYTIVNIIISGMVSGLISTGFYETLKNIIDNIGGEHE